MILFKFPFHQCKNSSYTSFVYADNTIVLYCRKEISFKFQVFSWSAAWRDKLVSLRKQMLCKVIFRYQCSSTHDLILNLQNCIFFHCHQSYIHTLHVCTRRWLKTVAAPKQVLITHIATKQNKRKFENCIFVIMNFYDVFRAVKNCEFASGNKALGYN